MRKISEVKVLPGYCLELVFDDGAHRVVNLPIWGDQIDLCPDALYLRATGKEPEDIALLKSANYL